MFAWPRASAIAEQAAGHPAAEAPAWPRATDAERRVATSDRRRSRGRVRTATGWLGLLIVLGFLVVAALADVLAPADPLVPVGPPLAPPSAAYRIGTDDLGRDLLSGLVYGVPTAVPVLARVVLVRALPSWVPLARVVRAEILSVRERQFVEAARALGCSELRILLRHMLPHALPATIVYFALLIAQVILVEASLGFLGLGDPNAISLGYLARQAQGVVRGAWWLWVFRA